MDDTKHTQIQMKKIPAFTVIKNGSILKNIFLLRKHSPINNSSQNQESDEEILYVGRHPHCHITLEHPSISRYHLRIRSCPSSQSLSVEDLSSVHGTWVSGKRIEPGVHVVVEEGDTVKLGGSSRVYELHWVECSRACDVDEQFVPAVYTIKEESNQDGKHDEYSSNDDLECLDLSKSNTNHDSPLKGLNSLTFGLESDDIFATDSTQDLLVVSETTSATQGSDNRNDSDDQLIPSCSKSSGDDTEVQSSPWRHEEYSLVADLGCSDLSTSNTIHNSSVSIQAPFVVSETAYATQVSDSLNDSEETNQAGKHEEYSSSDDLECLDLSSSNIIQDYPLKTLNQLTSGYESDDLFATVSIQAPLGVSETTSATQVSNNLNVLEDQLMMNCSKSACDGTKVEQSSPWKQEEYSVVDDLDCSNLSISNMIQDPPFKTLNPLSGNESDDIFATVSIQVPLVVPETASASASASASQVSDSLNDSEGQLMTNCSKSSCDVTEVEQLSPLKHEEYSLVDDLECLDLSSSNTIHDSPLNTLNPLTSGNESDDIFATVLIQAPLVVSETTSASQVSDSLNDPKDQLMANCSKSSCDDTVVEHSSPWKTGNGNGEPFINVCIQASEAISETEMSECRNKSEDKLNCLRGNLSNEFDQISHGTMEDDMGSIGFLNAIETNEKDALDQNIARSNETDIANEIQQKINDGSDEIREVGYKFEQMNQMKVVLYDGVNLGVESIDHEIVQKETIFGFLADVANMDEKTHTPDISKGKEIHTNALSAQKLSASMKLFDSLDGKELEFYTPDKENKNPNACSGKSLSKKAVNSVVFGEKDIFGFSQKLFANDEGMCVEQEEVNPFANCEEVFAVSSEKESKSIQMIMDERCNSFNYLEPVQKVANSSQNLCKNRWTMVVDTNSLLDPMSLKRLKLLEGIKGTQLFVPKNVVRELMDIKSQDNYFKRSSKNVSLALEWIDECMMKTRWWINMEDGETARSSKAVPDDDETAHSSKGTQPFVPNNVVRELMDFKWQENFFKTSSKKVSLALKWIDECMMKTGLWINMDDDETAHSSKAVPEVLAFALHLREEITDQKIIILSDNLTLKIKAMAEGIICEAADEFHKSLVSPFSERFMWVGSSARGLTWSCVDDDDIVRQKYHGSGINGSQRFRGLKLLARLTTSQLAS